MKIQTSHGQVIEVESQVVYMSNPDVKARSLLNLLSVDVTMPEFRIAKVQSIEQTGSGFAEADPTFELTLDNGARVDSEKVVVTDGRFSYAI